MQLPGCGDHERDWSLAHDPFDAAAGLRARIFDRGLMHDAALADERAQQHGKHVVFIGLYLVGFVDDKDGVGERAVVIYQGQRAAACQVAHEI